MKNILDQCFDVIKLLEDHFPGAYYQVVFRKDYLRVEKVRSDGGQHTGSKEAFHSFDIDWLVVTDDDLAVLPKKLLEKTRQRIMEWQQEGLDKVKAAAELEKAKNELEKRLETNRMVDRLSKEINPEVKS